jgi:hypothetical protein
MVMKEIKSFDHEEPTGNRENEQFEVVDILRKSLHRLEEMILGWAGAISSLRAGV